MPTYQYRCTECGADLEVVQKFSDAALTQCPTCGGSLRKIFNAVGVVFKGSGFYRTDSRTGNGSDSASSRSKSESSKDGKSSESGSGSGGSEGGGKNGSEKSAPKESSSGSGSSGADKKASTASTSTSSTGS